MCGPWRMASRRYSDAATPAAARFRCPLMSCWEPVFWFICEGLACKATRSRRRQFRAPDFPILTISQVARTYVNVINIHTESYPHSQSRGSHADRCKTGRVRKARLDRSHGPRVLFLVAPGPCDAGLHHWERTNELLESPWYGPLAPQDGAYAGEDGSYARKNEPWRRRVVGCCALQWQSRLR